MTTPVLFPTAFGLRAPIPVAIPGDQCMVTNRLMASRVATQSVHDTARLIAGMWGMLVAQNAKPHPAMEHVYPAILIPQVSCAQGIRHGSSGWVEGGGCEIGEGGVSECVWTADGHSPRCEGREVDWTAYVRGVLIWLAQKPSEDQVQAALSPTLCVPEQCDPSHQAVVRRGTVYWRAEVLQIRYLQMPDKDMLSRLLLEYGTQADRIIAICDGPTSKSEARFNIQNAIAYNNLRVGEAEFGSVATLRERTARFLAHGSAGKGPGCDPAPTPQRLPPTTVHASSSRRQPRMSVMLTHVLTLFALRNPYYVRPVVLSEPESAEKLMTKSILPELVSEISENDPLCLYHGITMPIHTPVPVPLPGQLKRRPRPPRIIMVIGDQGEEKYFRVVAATPGSNSITHPIPIPTRTKAYTDRFDSLTSMGL
jgi:hypothetical protein